MGTIKLFRGHFAFDGKLAQAIQLRYRLPEGTYDYVTTLYERDGSLWTDYGSGMLIESREIIEAKEEKTSSETSHPKLTDFFGGKLKNITMDVTFQDER